MEANEDRLAEVAGLLQEALRAGLLGAEWAAAEGLRWLADAYNGIGPEFFGEDLRKKTSRWFAIFKPAALIHDARNHVSDGTSHSFDNANTEFRLNCLLLADRAYPWWNWKRYRARLVADALYDFVSSPGGWKAWREAYERARAKAHEAPEAPEVPEAPENRNSERKTQMKKLMMLMLAACAAIAMTTTAGCRAVTVENYGEEVARDAENRPVKLADGTIQTVKKGWKVHHNQHWMNTSADSVTASVKPEEIEFAMNGLNTQPSEELNKLVGTSLDGLTKLAVAVGEAYVKIAGGGAQASTVLKTSKSVIDYFRAQGGDVAKATVTADEAANTLKVTDGSTCVQCDSAGNCSTCADPN